MDRYKDSAIVNLIESISGAFVIAFFAMLLTSPIIITLHGALSWYNSPAPMVIGVSVIIGFPPIIKNYL